MWCAVYVKGGSEAGVEAFLWGLQPKGVHGRCFHLRRSRRKKYGGQWRTVYENLMPGYVFLDTEQPEVVYRELKKIPGYRLLSSNDEFVKSLERGEADFLECIVNRDGEIGISRVSVTDSGEIRYLSGPLTGISHMVKKVNLHKRIAEVETRFMGEKRIFYLGIEIGEQDK